MADNSSNLTDSVPKIVITEPSPLIPIINPSSIQHIIRPSGDEIITVAPEPSASVATKSDLVPEANYPESTSDENVTSDSDASCSVSVEDKVQEVTMEVEEGGDLLTPPPPEDEVVEDEQEGVGAACCRWLENFSESKFMIAILSVLLTMPLAAGMMGARYMDKCPLSDETPIFLFMMGVLGTLVILCRIAVIVRKTSISMQCCDLPLLKSIIVFGCMAISLLLTTEMTSFLRISPNFEPGAPNYCHRNFYNFTYWLNWTSLFVIAFLGVLHIPKCASRNRAQNRQ